MYEKFALLLKSRNVSAAAVSKATKISPSTLSEWKSGKYTPKMDKMQKIADYFGVDVSYFSDENEQNTTPQENKKIPKDLKRILEDEEITLNGRMMSVEDKEKIYKVIEAMYWDAKEQNKRKKPAKDGDLLK